MRTYNELNYFTESELEGNFKYHNSEAFKINGISEAQNEAIFNRYFEPIPPKEPVPHVTNLGFRRFFLDSLTGTGFLDVTTRPNYRDVLKQHFYVFKSFDVSLTEFIRKRGAEIFAEIKYQI